MFALIIAALGAAYGMALMLAAGIPVIALRIFHLLPFDRRLWWTFAAVVAYFAVRDIILSSYQYSPPTSEPERFFFDAHMWGGRLGVISVFAIGLVTLFHYGHPDREVIQRVSVSMPLACLIVVLGGTTIARNTLPMEQRRTEYETRRSELVAAIRSGHVDRLVRLIQSGARIQGAFPELGDRSPLDFAIEKQDVAIVACLLDPSLRQKLRVTDRQYRDVLKTENQLLIEAFLVGNGRGRRQRLGMGLRAAIENDDRTMISFMLQQGADPNAQSGFDTPLIISARRNRLDLAAKLLKARADVNGLHGSPDLNRGSTPLIVAVGHNHKQMVSLLMDNNADVNRTTASERSALHAACRRGNVELVELLIEHGADVNYQSGARKNSAFHWTLNSGSHHSNCDEPTRARLVAILVAAGADPQIERRQRQHRT